MTNSNPMLKGICLFIIFSLLHNIAFTQGKIYYVDSAKADNTGNGLSWATAKNNIGYAMALAQAGDQVWVKKGTYLPTHDSTLAVASRNTQFFIKDGVGIYGGFKGNETLLSQRDNETLTKLRISQNSPLLDWQGTVYNNTGALNKTIKCIGITIDGFEIEYFIKGVCLNNNGKNYIKNNRFVMPTSLLNPVNHITGWIHSYTNGLSSIVVNMGFNVIDNNIFDTCYQAIKSTNATDTIKNNKFNICRFPIRIVKGKNSAFYNNLMANIKVVRTYYDYTYKAGDFTSVAAEGMLNIIGCDTFTISNNTFHHNIIEDHVDIRIQDIRSSGIIVVDTCLNTTIQNNIFYGNIYVNYDNRENQGTPLRSSIDVAVYRSPNTFFTKNLLQNPVSVYTAANFCDFSVIKNENNLFARNPQFVGTGTNPYALKASSPCINVGAWPIVLSDILNNTRGYFPSLGAYEFQPSVCPTAARLYVDSSIATSGNGTSWQQAFKTLDEALVTAQHCAVVNEIYVAKGTYKPGFKTFNFFKGENISADDREVCFHVPDGLTLYGGFPSGGGVRTFETNPTILDGDIGIQTNNTDNAYHIVVSNADSAIGKGIIVDGFTITNGNANAQTVTNITWFNWLGNMYGSGVYTIFGLNNTFTNCTLKNNNASYGAAGLFAYKGFNNIASNTFSQNTCGQFGAGLNIYGGWKNTISKNKFLNNTAGNGGAICIEHGKNSLLTDNIIQECTANAFLLGAGGGIYVRKDTVTIDGNRIEGNTASLTGGGINVQEGIALIKNNYIDRNKANIGGGITFYLNSKDTLVNNVIANNRATSSVGGVAVGGTDCNPVFINNTIVNNYAPKIGGVGINLSATGSFFNNIFWGNKVGEATNVAGADFSVSDGSSSTFNNNLLQLAATNYSTTSRSLGTTSSNNFFNTDPLFVDINRIANALGKYRTVDDGLNLKSTSPFLSKGIPFLTNITTNIIGAIRTEPPNLGAY